MNKTSTLFQISYIIIYDVNFQIHCWLCKDENIVCNRKLLLGAAAHEIRLQPEL